MDYYHSLSFFLQNYSFPTLKEDFSLKYIQNNECLQKIATGLTLEELKNEDLQHRNLEFEYRVLYLSS